MKLIKRYWYYICIIIVFSFMFYAAPPLCDRWMESSVLLETGGILRYLCGQVYWVKEVNIRFISNCFSYIIDRNIMFRAICNSAMIVLISAFYVKISGADKTKEQAAVGIFSALLLMLVSWGIKAEVYFYASTLYLSAFLLMGAVFYLDLRCLENGAKKSENALLYVLIIIGSLWLENNVPMMITATGMIWLIQCWKNKRLGKEELVPFIASILCGLSVFLLINGLAPEK